MLGLGGRTSVKLTKVLQNAEPSRWRVHRFGLSPGRWKSLGGQSFWITGAGTGYGRCLSCALAAAGARVFLTGRRVEKLRESIEEAKSFGIPADNCHVIPADISRVDDISKACEEVKRLSSSLNGLVNNAAGPASPGVSTPLQADSPEYWERMMRVNVTAPWLLTRTIFPRLLLSRHVRVLFMSSGAAWAATPGFGTYNVSKAALNSLAHSLAAEYADSFRETDIQMNVLVPGEARTEMNRTSEASPWSIASMALLLLSYPEGGPNGRFFHRDGTHLSFGETPPYDRPLN